MTRRSRSADRTERRERRRAGDLKRVTRGGKKLPAGQDVHVRLWKKLENGLSVSDRSTARPQRLRH